MAVDRAGFMYLLDDIGITKLTPGGEVVRQIKVGPGHVGEASGLGVDAAGNLYVLDYQKSSVDQFDPAGQLVRQFNLVGAAPAAYTRLNGLAVDPAGNLYVADTYNNRIQKFDQNGQLLFTYGSATTSLLKKPLDITLDSQGMVYVYGMDFVVTKLTPQGQLLQSFLLDAATVSYDEPTALAVDAAGNLYASSSQGWNIRKFSAAGAAMGTVGSFYGTRTLLACDAAGNLYATDRDHGGNSKLRKYNATGQLLDTWGNLTTLTAGVLDASGYYYCYNPRVGNILRYAPNGELLGPLPNSGAKMPYVEVLTIDPLGNLYLFSRGSSSTGVQVQKRDLNGRLLAEFTSLGFELGSDYHRAAMAADGAGNLYITDYYAGCVRRLGPQGQVLPPIGTWGTGEGQLWLPQAVALDAQGHVYATDNGGSRVQRFTPDGKLVREFGPRTSMNQSVSVSDVHMAVDRVGNIYVNTSLKAGVQFFAADGSSITTLANVRKGMVAIDPRGGRLVTSEGDLIRFYTNDQIAPQNLITGTVYQDRDNSCTLGETEPTLANIVVAAQPGNYYGLTDANGRYAIVVDTGKYTVSQLLPTNETGRIIVPLCTSADTVALPTYGLTGTGPDFGNLVGTAPYLTMHVGSNRRRRCFRNITTVEYANIGFAPAPDARVTVVLPPEVVFLSADFPHTRDAAGQYVFEVGTLAANSGGRIVIQDSVVCDNPDLRGLTVCTKAWITPLNTYPVPGWNGAAVTVQGRLEADNQVRFVLRNTSATTTADSLGLRLYQNSQLALTHRYLLAAGDSLVLRVPATRPVVRLEADQPANHPTQRTASSTVEVRSLSLNGQPNPDMLASPPNVPGPETAQDCQPILDSFDPNDKLVLPTGSTAQHYTPTGVPLRFTVRFQNTGNDDAYRVVVVDTLAADLDLQTLRVTAASGPYQLTVSGRGRPVLTFAFNNINLPPSSRDEAGSNGFVSFSIRPRADLPARALIENEADIFFDYNPAIRTNRTTNRIYDMPLEVEPAVAVSFPAVLASPFISQLTPAEGRAGTLVTLRGLRFDAGTAGNIVRFNGVATPVLSATATTLTVRVPPAATSGTVQVATADGAGRTTQVFTIYQPPTLTAVAPDEGIPGSRITLTGTEFGALAGQDTVWFNNTPALVEQATPTQLTVRVPANATSGFVRIGTRGGAVESTRAFTVWYPPTLAGFSPARGKAGTLVSITGSRFAPAERNTVLVGAGATATVVQATAESLQIKIPTGSQTGPLRVQTPGGTAVSEQAFTFLPAPGITSFSPAQASVGEVLTLTGTDFLVDGLADTVYVDGIRATVLTSSATQATVRVPAGAVAGPITMRGTGGAAESATAFRLLPLSAQESIAVYPNPARGMVTLDWLRADFAVERVRVYNALGGLVQEIDLSRNPATSQILHFAAGANGLYLLVVQTARGNVTKRLMLY
ncbi:IPT/TIG domain-containing protein [Hymenobacter sp. ISL-91]|uniref:DUF7619 domain-containing protein n=1 Tax=Hymenobacter sp. ISL-91 TaxID=2819151 RepID=UPI001BEB070E|nr:IPT/TIG domain-containing protein [Hymenobacter sp. ISL-91]MBT2557204.1 IPT/TIG domain-containing protein [Hymenobacter sp. ISL-91]